ncbi:uncharacterized protein MYCFIDRAFT_80690 [Pseudocercospora fijiensis CIRAD86]|uniref:F-box domain-containing protein n=1 Tax=Pseudocercospora fijiensis (strain CIRAD86) TaxID=383855 RepID=M3A1M0_PSEFD|nr:uncharacterized protein MYCFIDRAFT_80690 [Pseudocercospora fijiensis CIRAD86]EME78261.1 hypothetical protein MYCFIDRAFT_80690 [Pseudocercospora fijiensis CIRAD86]
MASVLSSHPRAALDPSVASADANDRLSALPPELLHHIIGYLWPTHFAEKAFHETRQSCRCSHCVRSTHGNNHDLDYLAATCKILRAEVNDWARSWLLQHSDITKFNEGRIWPKATTKRNGVVQMRKNFNTNFLRGRNGALLNWMDTNCIFCGRKSRRAAIMMNGFRCCTHCDKKEWPEKVTMSQAVEDYGLSKKELLPTREASHTEVARMREEFPGFQGIWYGTYVSSNVRTTMFMKHDLRRLATTIFGDVDAHLARRELRKKLVKQKKEERKKEKAERATEKAATREPDLNALAVACTTQQIPAGWPLQAPSLCAPRSTVTEISEDTTAGADQDQPIVID